MTDRTDLAAVAPGLPAEEPQREQILARHGDAIERNQDGYMDPKSGFFVMTAAYLLARGTCCESKCRHCPY